MILAIDPGNIESAYCVIEEGDLRPVYFAKEKNELIFEVIAGMNYEYRSNPKTLVLEMIAHYGTGMPAGKTVFDTCVWIGRYHQYALQAGYTVEHIYRKDEKMNFSHSMKAKDGNIIQALKDRFGDKGTKKNPGWFYGFSGDIWQAYAVGVTYYDMYIAKKEGA